MKSSDIPRMSNAELVFNYVLTQISITNRCNFGGATKQLEAQCNKLEVELLNRELITEDHIKRLRG